jgi:hypothetical protein
MKPTCFAIAAWLVLLTSDSAITTANRAAIADKFPSDCLPFNAPSKHHPVDAQCGPSGEPITEESRKQDVAKNNLCASGTPVLVTAATFDDLQKAAQDKGISFGNQHVPHPKPLPSDRSVLKNLAKNADGLDVGEGTNVQFVAFVFKTKQGGSESVNCNLPGKEANDIHIVLSPNKTNTDECSSVTAEMVPHFRPDAWNKISFQRINAKLQKHPVRITGQMFFDASHAPCGHPDHKDKGDPKRRSNWEIHPLYTIDVCKNNTLTGCPVDDDSKWKSFDKWVQNPQ